MPYRTTREWVPAICLRCDEAIRDAKRNRKWCRECRTWARVGNVLRQALRELDRVHSDGAPEARAAIAEIRERLSLGEDLFPLDGAMSVARFARRGRGGPIPRDRWVEIRGAIEAARREVAG